jgi:hypothetical protein
MLSLFIILLRTILSLCLMLPYLANRAAVAIFMSFRYPRSVEHDPYIQGV